MYVCVMHEQNDRLLRGNGGVLAPSLDQGVRSIGYYLIRAGLRIMAGDVVCYTPGPPRGRGTV